MAQQQQGGRTLPEAAWPELLALTDMVHGKVLLCRLRSSGSHPDGVWRRHVALRLRRSRACGAGSM